MSERVQLNLSILAEEKLALQALAEGRGVSVTKLVLSLIYGGAVGPVPGPVVTAGISAGPGAGAVDDRPKETRTPSHGGTGSVGGSQSISTPAEVPDAVERIAPSRTFQSFSKEAQAGRKPKERR